MTTEQQRPSKERAAFDTWFAKTFIQGSPQGNVWLAWQAALEWLRAASEPKVCTHPAHALGMPKDLCPRCTTLVSPSEPPKAGITSTSIDLTEDQRKSLTANINEIPTQPPTVECTKCHCLERAQQLIGDPRVCVTVNPAPHAAAPISSTTLTGIVCSLHGFYPRAACPVCINAGSGSTKSEGL